MNVLPILRLVVLMARVMLGLFALINLIGLVWFAGSYNWMSATLGILVVVGSAAVAFIPQSLLRERSAIVAYASLLFLTAAAIMLFVYNDLLGSVTSSQRAGERMLHMVLLGLVGGSVLWHAKQTTR